MISAEECRQLLVVPKLDKIEEKIKQAAVHKNFVYIVIDDFEDDLVDETLEQLGEFGFIVEIDARDSWKVSW